jgi:hypothetical protein
MGGSDGSQRTRPRMCGVGGWLLACTCFAALQPTAKSSSAMFASPCSGLFHPQANAKSMQAHQRLYSTETAAAAAACVLAASVSNVVEHQGGTRPQGHFFASKGVAEVPHGDNDQEDMCGSAPHTHINSSMRTRPKASKRGEKKTPAMSARSPHLLTSACANKTAVRKGPEGAGSPSYYEIRSRAMWFRRFCDLVVFKQRHGKCRVPTQTFPLHSGDGSAIPVWKNGTSVRKAKERQMQKRFGKHHVLGKWVAKQRHQLKRGIARRELPLIETNFSACTHASRNTRPNATCCPHRNTVLFGGNISLQI